MSSVRTNSIEYNTVEPPSSVIKEGSFTSTQTKDEVHDDEVRGLIETLYKKYGGTECVLRLQNSSNTMRHTSFQQTPNIVKISRDHIVLITSGFILVGL